MRQVQHGRKPRGRGRKQHNPLSRIYDSSGPDTKIRGTAAHIAEKYQSLARDATSSGHRVVAENYLQHAEHYLRIVAVAQAAMQPAQVNPGQSNSNHENTGRGDQSVPGERRDAGDAGDENTADGAPAGENSQGSRGETGSQTSGRNRRGQRRRQPAFDNAAVETTSDKPEKNEAGEGEPAPESASDQSKKPPKTEVVNTEDKSVNGVSKPESETQTAPPRRRTRRKPKVADEGQDSEIAADAGTAEIA